MKTPPGLHPERRCGARCNPHGPALEWNFSCVEITVMSKKHNSQDLTDEDDVLDWDSEPAVEEDDSPPQQEIHPAARRRIERLMEERALRRQIGEVFDDYLDY